MTKKRCLEIFSCSRLLWKVYFFDLHFQRSIAVLLDHKVVNPRGLSAWLGYRLHQEGGSVNQMQSTDLEANSRSEKKVNRYKYIPRYFYKTLFFWKNIVSILYPKINIHFQECTSKRKDKFL